MSITKNPGRQEIVSANVEINFGDVASGVAAAAIQLPAGAVITGGQITTLTAFNSGTSDVLDVGDSGSANRYVNDANIHATGRVALTPTGYEYTAQTDLTVTWVGVGAVPTAGKVRLDVQYYVAKREAFSQG